MSEHASFEIAANADTIWASSPSRGIPPVALLYSDEALLAHVESALGDMGAPVVYRAPVTQADRDALLATRPAIALINLDDRCEDNLDEVATWLDAARVPVVFNDAHTSRILDGWARARWARHLAAKLRDSEDVYPPRPAQAESPRGAQPAVQAADATTDSMQAFDIGADEVAEIVPIASRPLTPGEIHSLLADFPSEREQPADDNTDALSAHVDALLAEPICAPAETAPWDVVAPLEDAPVAAANEAAPAAAQSQAQSAAPRSIPNFASWELVDDSTVVSAPPPARAETAPQPAHIKFDFELEPLDDAPQVLIVRDREFTEMRLDDSAAHHAEASQ